MKKMLKILPLFIMTVYSCGQITIDQTSRQFNLIDFNLIQICVDSTLQLDPGLNTGKYLIDFSQAKTLDRQSIDNFLRANPTATETNSDSLVKHDTTWIKYQFFPNPLIRFEKIIKQQDGTILINTSKTKASDGSIGTKIILQRQGDNFKCLKREITWVS